MYVTLTRFSALFLMAIFLVCISACDDDIVAPANLLFQSPQPGAVDVYVRDSALETTRSPAVSPFSNQDISAIAWSVTKDTLQTPRGIEGEYKGLLFVTENATSGGAKKTDSMPVTLVFRLGDDKLEQEGTYAHVYDTTADSMELPRIFCDIKQGSWFTRDGKIFLAPGPTDPGSVCDPTIVPNSFIVPPGGGETIEVGFGPTKLKLPPLENEIGDSLILRQIRFDADRETVFRLELLSIPSE